MSKLIFFSFISFLFLVSFKFTKKIDENQVETNSLLWKIEGNDLNEPSYLFGTMHLIQKEYFYFPKSLEKIIKKSKCILTEINLGELDNQEDAIKLMMLPDGHLMDFFNQSQTDSILKWVKNKLYLDEKTFVASFGKFKPFVLIQTATQISFIGKTESYELKIQEIGNKNKIELLGLETIAEQIGFFDNMSKTDQAEMVMDAISEETNLMHEMNLLQRIYKAQKLDSLQIIMSKDKSSLNKHEQILLTKRNINWIPKIEKAMKEKSTFIAVGAGHLTGSQGLLELLQTKGYKLSSIKM